MKLMIASDLHGSAHYVKKFLDRYRAEAPDRLLLLGDLLYHGPRNPLPQDYDCPAVAEVLRSVTGAHLGREVAVRFTLGKGETPPAGQAPDKLDALIRAGSKYDSFTVK